MVMRVYDAPLRTTELKCWANRGIAMRGLPGPDEGWIYKETVTKAIGAQSTERLTAVADDVARATDYAPGDAVWEVGDNGEKAASVVAGAAQWQGGRWEWQVTRVSPRKDAARAAAGEDKQGRYRAASQLSWRRG